MRISFREYLGYYLRDAYAGAFDGVSRPRHSIRDVLSVLVGALNADGVRPLVQLSPAESVPPRRYRHIHYRALFWRLSGLYAQFAVRHYAPPDLMDVGSLSPSSVSVDRMVPQEDGLSRFDISWRDVLIPPGGVS